MKIFKILSLLLLPLLTISCSTMFNSGSQSISVVGGEGEEGVAVQVRTPDGVYKSKLPATIITTPSTFNPTEVKITDKCYDEVTIQIKKNIAPSFFANIFNYCIGCFIDPLTGAMWKLNNHTVIPLNRKAQCGGNQNYSSTNSRERDASSLAEMEDRIRNICDQEYDTLKKEISMDWKTFMHKCKLEKRKSFVNLGL